MNPWLLGRESLHDTQRFHSSPVFFRRYRNAGLELFVVVVVVGRYFEILPAGRQVGHSLLLCWILSRSDAIEAPRDGSVCCQNVFFWRKRCWTGRFSQEVQLFHNLLTCYKC